MKMVVPITIDDDNMTTDAVAESYDTWGTDVSLKTFAPATASDITLGGANKRIWENPITRNIYVSSGNSVYKQNAGTGGFSLFSTLDDFSIAGITDITGDPSRGVLYVVGYTNSTSDGTAMDVYEIPLDTGVSSVWYNTEDVVALDCDEYTGEVYIFQNDYVTRKRKTASGLYSTIVYFSATNGITGGCVDAFTKNVYIATSDEGILLKTAGTGTPSMISGTDAYVWGYLSVNRTTLDVFGVISTGDVYKQSAGTGAFTLYEGTYSYGAVFSSWLHLGLYLLPSAAGSSIYIQSSKFFVTGQYCVYNNRVYYALVTAINIRPGTDDTKWFDYGATNPYRMFDGAISTPTTATGEINITLDNDNVTAIGFFGVTAKSIQVVLTVDAVEVYDVTTEMATIAVSDWYEYFFSPITHIEDVVIENIPQYLDGAFTITISGASPTDTVEVGLLVAGYSYDVGTTKRGVKPGFVNYSTTEVDDFGRISIVPRGSAKMFDCECFIASRAEAIGVLDLYSRTKDIKCLWIGSRDADTWSLIYGICKRFDATIDDHNGKYSLQILGVV